MYVEHEFANVVSGPPDKSLILLFCKVQIKMKEIKKKKIQAVLQLCQMLVKPTEERNKKSFIYSFHNNYVSTQYTVTWHCEG